VRGFSFVKNGQHLVGNDRFPLERDSQFMKYAVLGYQVLLHPFEIVARFIEAEQKGADARGAELPIDFKGKLLDLAPSVEIPLLVDRVLVGE